MTGTNKKDQNRGEKWLLHMQAVKMSQQLVAF